MIDIDEKAFEPVPFERLNDHLQNMDKALRNAEPMYQRLHAMGQRLVDGLPIIKELEGKDAILLLGPTGSGKSTIAASMIGGTELLTQDPETK